ncbi:hypothetical protein [Nonomuraea rubra]|uniref:Uncharacterized protein n=2 Tax=Nonomuraea rubra TaxID=46180 RepID=A0A7X0NNR9_9ACTN|nr:hypothetical protein [Nonomuraea rubra]MBB6546865.1 hypothetical protein [Nonomuraea rubra]
MAMEGGIEVSDFECIDGPWPDDDITALVAPNRIVFNPSLEDDDLRADVLAFAAALCCSLVLSDSAPAGHVAAPGGLVLIGREKLPEPPTGPGRLAGMFARRCGKDTTSATFKIYIP